MSKFYWSNFSEAIVVELDHVSHLHTELGLREQTVQIWRVPGRGSGTRKAKVDIPSPEGYLCSKVNGDVWRKWVTFSRWIPKHGSIFILKIPKSGSLFFYFTVPFLIKNP